MSKLSSAALLKVNQSAIIVGFYDDVVAMKLNSMGVLLNANITVIRKAPFGKTFYVKINQHQMLALRLEEMQQIKIA